jgi:hypothetical protein
MVCDPTTADVKEEVNGKMSTTSSTASIVQLYNNAGHPFGGKRWTVDALYESCRLKVLMASTGQMGWLIFIGMIF